MELQQNPVWWENSKIMVTTDVTTAVAYINNQGGSLSMPLLDLILDLWPWSCQYGLPRALVIYLTI